jgi:hypothetical protein
LKQHLLGIDGYGDQKKAIVVAGDSLTMIDANDEIRNDFL